MTVTYPNLDAFYAAFKEESPQQTNLMLSRACGAGKLDFIKYILTSKDLKVNADIKFYDSECLANACSAGHFEIVKYLLTSPELKEHANIHGNDDLAFRWAVDHKRMEIVKFFILDMNIEKTPQIMHHLNNYPNPEVESLFLQRELAMHEDRKNHKKSKI